MNIIATAKQIGILENIKFLEKLKCKSNYLFTQELRMLKNRLRILELENQKEE